MVSEIFEMAFWLVILLAFLCACWGLWKVWGAVRESQARTVVCATVERRSSRKEPPIFSGKPLELAEWDFCCGRGVTAFSKRRAGGLCHFLSSGWCSAVVDDVFSGERTTEELDDAEGIAGDSHFCRCYACGWSCWFGASDWTCWSKPVRAICGGTSSCCFGARSTPVRAIWTAESFPSTLSFSWLWRGALRSCLLMASSTGSGNESDSLAYTRRPLTSIPGTSHFAFLLFTCASAEE